jgi:quercetin dioxygenase-like cupin family protein
MKSKEMFAGSGVAAGDDRSGEKVKWDGDPMDDKVSAEDTNDGLCLFEFTGGVGGPSHLHHDQDEWFTDIDGEVELPVGETRIHLGAGESDFISHNIAHVGGCANGRTGKIIHVYQPAGQMGELLRAAARLKDRSSRVQVIQTTRTEGQK